MIDQSQEQVDSEAAATDAVSRLLTVNTVIVGVRFYSGAADLLARITEVESFTLIREPDNKHDRNAIAVYVDDMKCGHIPAPQAKFLAPLLDALL